RGTSLTLAQRWNGHTWSILPTPSPADGGNLIGVSCPSRSSCLAVGGHGNPFNEIPPGTLAERWNGRGWRIQPTPNPPGGGWWLTAVACTAPSACTAVGGSIEPPGRTPGGTLAERWNGHTWRIQPTPSLPGKAVKLLGGVACTSRSSCMAVGNEFDPATGQSLGTLAERWDGRTWRILPTFKPAPARPATPPTRAPPAPPRPSAGWPAPRPQRAPRSPTRPSPDPWPSGGTATPGASRPPPTPAAPRTSPSPASPARPAPPAPRSGSTTSAPAR